MPDWFYRTASRPLLYRLSAPAARDFALGFMGILARLPLGPAVIDFMGHMRPDPRLAENYHGLDFRTPVGLGPWLDRAAVALPALARFGLGFLEVGPVFVDACAQPTPVQRDDAAGCLRFTEPLDRPGLDDYVPRIVEARRLGLPCIVHLGLSEDGDLERAMLDAQHLLHALAAHAAILTVPIPAWVVEGPNSADRWRTLLSRVYQAALERGDAQRPPSLLLRVGVDASLDELSPFFQTARAVGFIGVAVDGSLRADDGARLVGAPGRDRALALVQQLRNMLAPDEMILAGGGIHEPGDALELRRAGANLVSIDSGLVFTGPGLFKRINEVLLYGKLSVAKPPTTEKRRVGEMSWFWLALMGLGMLAGSVLALVIAVTRVVLPYDERFVGMDRDELHGVNDRLLSFMSHDRVSLAGAMVAIGAIYLGLAVFAVRRGHHWAQLAIFLSAFTGFASFFLFLGFGYLDPFHAFVTAILFQLLLFGLHCKLGPYVPTSPPELRGGRAWLMSLWGQFLLILHGCGLLGAGVVISAIGVTHVFVPEDLEFMQTSAETLRQANPHLVPLVAHDRATLGGMLLASGWLFLLFPMWGFRPGSQGLWWTYLFAGAAAYTAAIGVHYHVGYIDLGHLLPAYSGLLILLTGLGLSRPYLCNASPR